MSEPFVCLMYHEVLDGEQQSGARDFFAVTRTGFARHLDVIAAAGLRGCTLGETLASSDRAIAITFDDGSAGEFHHAVPELIARGMRATFFITTEWVGQPDFVTWEQLRTMQVAGMEIGSHTRTHPFLSELGERDLREELAASRSEIEREIGHGVTSLALPGGDAPRARFRRMLADVGYSVVATSKWGINRASSRSVPRYVRRCTVHGRLTDDEFRKIILGDASLSRQRRSREWVLATARRIIGPSRYARWRRRVLDRS